MLRQRKESVERRALVVKIQHELGSFSPPLNHEIKQLEEAVGNYQHALELNPDDEEAKLEEEDDDDSDNQSGKEEEINTRVLIYELLDFVDDVVPELGSRHAINNVHKMMEVGTGAEAVIPGAADDGQDDRDDGDVHGIAHVAIEPCHHQVLRRCDRRRQEASAVAHSRYVEIVRDRRGPGAAGRRGHPRRQMSDCVFVTGLALHAYHGVMQHEAKVGQTFMLDLKLEIDAARLLVWRAAERLGIGEAAALLAESDGMV